VQNGDGGREAAIRLVVNLYVRLTTSTWAW